MQNVIKGSLSKVGSPDITNKPAAKTQLSLLFTTVKEATVLKIFVNISERGSKVRTY